MCDCDMCADGYDFACAAAYARRMANPALGAWTPWGVRGNMCGIYAQADPMGAPPA